jgi:cytochrome c
MFRRLHVLGVLMSLVPLAIGTDWAKAADGQIDGKALLAKNCARCHAITAKGGSPLEGAPPLREVYRRYPIQQLEYGFAEGLGSKHPDMPQIQFSTEQVTAILEYLGKITGVPPAERPRVHVPDETEPP